MIVVYEKQLISKDGNPETNEDGIFINDSYIAVVDGVTAKGMLKWNGKKSGRHARDIILEALKKAPADFRAREMILYLNRSLFDEYGENTQFFKENKEERLQANIILYSAFKKEVWCFGDCRCIVNGEIHLHEKAIDRFTSELRSKFLEEEIKRGKTVEELMRLDTGREHIMPYLLKQTDYANAKGEFGYDVLDGFEIDADRTVIYKPEANSEIVLASDGYPVLRGTLEESERELQYILSNDKLLFRLHKETKGLISGNLSFDDRAYIRFTDTN